MGQLSTSKHHYARHKKRQTDIGTATVVVLRAALASLTMLAGDAKASNRDWAAYLGRPFSWPADRPHASLSDLDKRVCSESLSDQTV